MDEEKVLGLVGYVKVSKCRVKTLQSIGENFKIPTEIAREIDARTSQVSGALTKKKKKELIICVNEEAKKGRVYKCTDLGLMILQYL